MALEVLAVAGKAQPRLARLDPQLVDRLLQVGGRAEQAAAQRGEDETRPREAHVGERQPDVEAPVVQPRAPARGAPARLIAAFADDPEPAPPARAVEGELERPGAGQ